MTRIFLLACALATARDTTAQTRPAAGEAANASPVSETSLLRMRTALMQPAPKLTLTARTPDFKMSIDERRAVVLMTPILDFKLGPGFPQSALFGSPFGSQPMFSVNLMSVAMAGVAGAKALKKAHSMKSARDEVRRSIAAYCAAQPNAGAGITICKSGG